MNGKEIIEMNFTYANESNIKNKSLLVRRRSSSSENKCKVKNILKESLLPCENMNNENKSTWKNFKNKISNIKNNIIYNTLSPKNLFNFHKFLIVRIFDKIYYTKDDLNIYNHDIQNIIYISYRNHIWGILNVNTKNIYMNDCGWGCMIRSAQMMLANAIQSVFQFDNYLNGNFVINDSTQQTIDKTIRLFLDCPIKMPDEPKISISKKDTEMIGTIDLNSNDSHVKLVLPSFSIQNICKVGELINKFPGECFSDVNMAYIFQQLNSELNPITNLRILNFNEGVIYNEMIIKTCFEKSLSVNENSLEFENENFIFRNIGVIFISIRLGIDKISNNYLESIKDIYSISNNLGLIGGKSNDAHYFIDPHFNQASIKNTEELEKNLDTYLKKQILHMPIKNISPAFTAGFIFKSFKEYNKLVRDLKAYSLKEYPCFSFKDKQNEIKIVNNDYFLNNRNDDF